MVFHGAQMFSQLKYIQFPVKNEERKWKIFRFKKLESASENFDFISK